MPLIKVITNEPRDLVVNSSVAFEDIGKALLEFYPIYQQALTKCEVAAKGFTVEAWPGRFIFIDNPTVDGPNDFFQREEELCAQIRFSSFEKWWSEGPKRPLSELAKTVRKVLITTKFSGVVGNRPVMVMPFDSSNDAVRL